MSSLDFEDKVFVGIVAGAIALVALVNVFKPAEARDADLRIARTYQVASLPAEQPHYAITYTFPRLSKECLVDRIAPKDQARCEIELARPASEKVRLVAPKSTYALEAQSTINR